MLNKKAQFMENMDIIVGLILFAIGIFIFSLFSTIDTQLETEEISLDNSIDLSLINIISDDYFRENYLDYLQDGQTPSLMDQVGKSVNCQYRSTEENIELYNEYAGSLWKILITETDLEKHSERKYKCPLFDVPIFADGTIYVPTKDPELVLKVEFNK